MPLSISGTLPRVADILRTSASVRHSELHPIVATLINGMDEITSQKGPRKLARKDPARVSAGLRRVLSRFLTRGCNVLSDFHPAQNLLSFYFWNVCRTFQLLTWGHNPAIQYIHLSFKHLASARDSTVRLTEDGHIRNVLKSSEVHRFKLLETIGIV
jgi:hypothetical protein